MHVPHEIKPFILTVFLSLTCNQNKDKIVNEQNLRSLKVFSHIVMGWQQLVFSPGDPFVSSKLFSPLSTVYFLSDNEIVCFLKVQLAEAINLQDKNQIAQIQETTRCVSRFDARACRKLLAAIAEDYR